MGNGKRGTKIYFPRPHYPFSIFHFPLLNLFHPNYQSLKEEEIVRLAASGYQLAHFDAENQAFFVVSDLPQTENSATAEILMNSVRQHFTKPDKEKLAILAKF